MKKIINISGISSLFIWTALLFVAVSCSKPAGQESPLADSSQLIKVSGEDANAATKTTLSGLVTSWVVTDDKVGIYSPQARTATAGGGTVIVNAPFTAASSGVSSNFTGTMYWGAANSSHTFYAYYPYNSGYSGASDVVPITLATAQTQSEAGNNAHIGALDFMVATPVTQTSPANTEATSGVNLKYNHVFSILEFQIVGTGTLKYVKLVVPTNPISFSGGTINLNQTPTTGISYTIAGTTGTSKEIIVTLTTPATLSSTPTTVYMVINPGTQTGNCTIGLSSDGTNYLTISKAALDGGFLRGKKYVVAIDKATAVATAPDAPIIGTATMGDTQARVTFSAPNNGGSVITSYTATSSPGGLTGSGTASSITVTGLTNGIAYTFTVTATNTIGTSVPSSASNSITPLVIPVVTNTTTGKIWMDRNLGASQVATSSTDAAAYGDLYQWGRAADGHQIRTSGTTSTLSTTDAPGHANFILASSDWRSPKNDDLWQGETGTNNPCPSGFRIPTEAEFNAEKATWSSQYSAGAYASPLKFTAAGLREGSNGSLDSVGSYGDYWSSSVGGIYSRTLVFSSGWVADINSYNRANGHSVRCIKN